MFRNKNKVSSSRTDAEAEEDWLDTVLEQLRPVTFNNDEYGLATALIEQAFAYTTQTKTPLGISLAAAFDLLVAVEYYKRATHIGWIYCSQHPSLLIYPFTNTCPRCVLSGRFHYHAANKPSSGQIGQATSRLLCMFLHILLKRNLPNLSIYQGVEPVDVVFVDKDTATLLFAEIKASPLTTLALATPSEILTEEINGAIQAIDHISTVNLMLNSLPLSLLLPNSENATYSLIELGIRGNNPIDQWLYSQMGQMFGKNDTNFIVYANYWKKAFQAYSSIDRNSSVFWLTNGCGQPSPRPAHWPARINGSGFESVSDGKTSVGMDRTDDIKKGIYQVLKIGVEAKQQSSRFKVKTALISNIHAVRHYNQYLKDLQDIVWTVDATKSAKMVQDLPPETPLYNLFDGIIAFTESNIRDEWLTKLFFFQ